MVLGNIEKAIEAKFDSLKLNVVVMRNFNDDEILDFVEYTSKRDLELWFIEFMPFDDNKWSESKMVPNKDV